MKNLRIGGICHKVEVPNGPRGHAGALGEAGRGPDEPEIRKLTSFGPTKRSGPTWWKVNVEIQRSLRKQQNVNKLKMARRLKLLCELLRVNSFDSQIAATLVRFFVSFTRNQQDVTSVHL